MRWRRLLEVGVALALVLPVCAYAQEEGEGPGEAGEEEPKPKRERKQRPPREGRRRGPQQQGLVEGCPILSRLTLTEEQLAKVKEIEEELKAKVEELKTAAGDDRKKKRELPKQIAALTEEYRAKVVALLTEEQKARYQAGAAIMADYKTRLEAATAVLKTARKEAGKDKDKIKEVMTAHKERLKALETERDQALDEKVKGVAAAGGEAAGGGGEEAGGDVM